MAKKIPLSTGCVDKIVYDQKSGPKTLQRLRPVKDDLVSFVLGIVTPDREHISTSFVERQNLTVRMQNRRFTRLTNAFSKRWRNHEHAIALHYFNYNFCRKHLSLGMTPAQSAGLTNRVWTIKDLVVRLEAAEKMNAYHGRINKQDRK